MTRAPWAADVPADDRWSLALPGDSGPGLRQLHATCTPPLYPSTQTQTCTHSLSFSLGLSLLNTGSLLPPPPPPPPMCLSVCLSLNHSTFSPSHTLACYSSSPARCEDDCLWTDIYDTGRMCWINCVCIGIDPANRHSGNPLFHDYNYNKYNCFGVKVR